MVDFKQKLKDVPDKPGVYMMLDEDGGIIYVGKAKKLCNRLRQYFTRSGNKTEKVMAMLNHVADFRYIICQSEVDALVAENNLIKEHKPHYNILLKDDKAYPFLRIDMKEPYPTIKLVRTLKDDGARYFGPYMVSVNVRDIFDLIHTAFKVRDCNRDMLSPSRPCLNYHMGRCLAPCSGKVSEAEYRAEIDKVIAFLKGDDKHIEQVLTERMKHFSSKQNYEVALNYRDKLKVLDKLIRKQVSAIPKDYDLDVFAMETNGVLTAVTLMVIRGGKFVGADNYVSEGVLDNLSSYIYAFYVTSPPVCDEIVASVDDEGVLSDAVSALSGKRVRVVEPKQGVRKQLLDLAHSNAKDALEKHGTSEERKALRTTGAVQQLADLLGLPKLPNRIEAYDISHISGVDKVASMVVFEGGEAKRAHYRKFKIKTVEGNNDFACMKETLLRRLHRYFDESDNDESFKSAPDLILIDGGKGQLAYAKDAMRLAGADFPILSLAKREEEVYLEEDGDPYILPKDSVALQLLQRVRDEAHRFAITFHRSLHGKRMSVSEFRKIDGVGEKTASLLYSSFGSLENARSASVADFKAAGIGDKLSQKIYTALHDSILGSQVPQTEQNDQA